MAPKSRLVAGGVLVQRFLRRARSAIMPCRVSCYAVSQQAGRQNGQAGEFTGNPAGAATRYEPEALMLSLGTDSGDPLRNRDLPVVSLRKRPRKSVTRSQCCKCFADKAYGISRRDTCLASAGDHRKLPESERTEFANDRAGVMLATCSQTGPPLRPFRSFRFAGLGVGTHE